MTEKYKTIIRLNWHLLLHCKPAKSIIKNSRSHWFSKANTLVWAEPCARWAELKMLSFWAGGISSFPPCAREYRLLRRLQYLKFIGILAFQFEKLPDKNTSWPPCSQQNTVGIVLVHCSSALFSSAESMSSSSILSPSLSSSGIIVLPLHASSVSAMSSTPVTGKLVRYS